MKQRTSEEFGRPPVRRLVVDLTGQVFHRLTVEEPRSTGRGIRWRCRCECGGITYSGGAQLKRGTTKSCGCIAAERLKALNTTHGKASRRSGVDPALASYYSARRRCTVPGSPGYAAYGGAGIKMDENWVNDPQAFLDHMGDRPAGTSLDRIDNDKGYEPGNCRWATPAQQSANQRKTVLVTYRGETLALRAFCRKWGLSDGCFYYQHRVLGKTVEEAFAAASKTPRRPPIRPR